MQSSPRFWLAQELDAFGRGLPAGTKVLDAGSGDQRYQRFFAHCSYESADFEQVDKAYRSSTHVCDLGSIPVEDGRYSAVVFTQVMEHLPDPLAVLKELHRVLEPGGRLFYSGPFWYEEHEAPYDFYRYTQYGVRHLFTTAGFQIAELRWMDGYMASVAHQLRGMGRFLPHKPSGYGSGPGAWLSFLLFMAFRVACVLMAPLATLSDKRFRYTRRGYPMTYMAIVRKPGLV